MQQQSALWILVLLPRLASHASSVRTSASFTWHQGRHCSSRVARWCRGAKMASAITAKHAASQSAGACPERNSHAST